MPTLLTISTLFVSFFITLIATPFWIRRARKAGLLGEDVHKKERNLVAELGGLCVILGFLVGVLAYIAVSIFVYEIITYYTLLFATISSVLIATIIGLVDDILGWKIGLRIRYKIALTFFIALPIMAINAGQSQMYLPLIGSVNFGILYPLVLIPLAIVGASNGFNMLAGYNGLEAGMGIIILSTLGLISWITDATFSAVIAFAMVFALLAFYLYNRYPSRIFPGDTLTYSVGALIAIIAITANLEKFALILFIPYFLEFILKARGKFKKESFAKVDIDGSLIRPYKKYYGMEHITINIIKRIKKKAFEWEVVGLILFSELFLAILTVVYFFVQLS